MVVVTGVAAEVVGNGGGDGSGGGGGGQWRWCSGGGDISRMTQARAARYWRAGDDRTGALRWGRMKSRREISREVGGGDGGDTNRTAVAVVACRASYGQCCVSVQQPGCTEPLGLALGAQRQQRPELGMP